MFFKNLFLVNEFDKSDEQIALNWLYVLIMLRTRFRVNPRSIFAWMSRNSLLETGTMSEV